MTEMQFEKNKEKELYADLIDLPHPVSKKYPKMSMQERAAQFSPFSALTGHKEAIMEVERMTEERYG